MKTPTVKTILADPSASYWLQNAIKTAGNRDILDALRDAETLVAVLTTNLNNEH